MKRTSSVPITLSTAKGEKIGPMLNQHRTLLRRLPQCQKTQRQRGLLVGKSAAIVLILRILCTKAFGYFAPHRRGYRAAVEKWHDGGQCRHVHSSTDYRRSGTGGDHAGCSPSLSGECAISEELSLGKSSSLVQRSTKFVRSSFTGKLVRQPGPRKTAASAVWSALKTPVV